MLVTSPAIVLSSLQYSETSRIVRLATREYGMQSAIAKGALRPRSRFGAALQNLSEGIAHLSLRDNRDLQTLTAFDSTNLHAGLSTMVARFATATAMAEVMIRFAPREAHPEIFDLLSASFSSLESVTSDQLEPLGLRLLWLLVSVLGFAPTLDACVKDGVPLDETGDVAFSPVDGGVLCTACARGATVTLLPADARSALFALLDSDQPLPSLDARHAHAHRRLLSRFLRYHLNESAEAPAVAFWERGGGAVP